MRSFKLLSWGTLFCVLLFLNGNMWSLCLLTVSAVILPATGLLLLRSRFQKVEKSLVLVFFPVNILVICLYYAVGKWLSMGILSILVSISFVQALKGRLPFFSYASLCRTWWVILSILGLSVWVALSAFSIDLKGFFISHPLLGLFLLIGLLLLPLVLRPLELLSEERRHRRKRKRLVK